jgi:hypothetical protein
MQQCPCLLVVAPHAVGKSFNALCAGRWVYSCCFTGMHAL